MPFCLGEGRERLLLEVGLAASVSNSFGLEKVAELDQKKNGKGQKANLKTISYGL